MSSNFTFDFSSLSLLTRAPSSSTLNAYLSRVYINLPSATLRADFPPPSVTTISDVFTPQLTPDESASLYKATSILLDHLLYNHVPSDEASATFTSMIATVESNSKNLDARVLQLLTKTLPNLLNLWHESCISNKVSPPKLTSIDWRVDIPRSSNSTTSLGSSSSLILSLGVTPNGDCDAGWVSKNSNGNGGGEKKVLIEMDRAGVDTFLEGLGKIRDQLNKVS